VFIIEGWMQLLLAIVITAVVAGGLFFILGITYRKRVAEAEIGGAETEAKRIINDAIKASESKKRELLLEAKEETHKIKLDLERELKERRLELQKQESERVYVQIPKFKVEYGSSLISALQSMGMKDAFSDNADFGKLTDESVRIDSAEHKAVINI
jgi:serine protease inhibitor